jgi:hypothetical protein
MSSKLIFSLPTDEVALSCDREREGKIRYIRLSAPLPTLFTCIYPAHSALALQGDGYIHIHWTYSYTHVPFHHPLE